VRNLLWDGTPPGLKQIKTCFGSVLLSLLPFFSSKRFDAKKTWMVQPPAVLQLPSRGRPDDASHAEGQGCSQPPFLGGGLGPLGTPKVGVSLLQDTFNEEETRFYIAELVEEQKLGQKHLNIGDLANGGKNLLDLSMNHGQTDEFSYQHFDFKGFIINEYWVLVYIGENQGFSQKP
jgi:hypothetical protein